MTEPTATQSAKQGVKKMSLSLSERLKVTQAKTQKQSSQKDLDVAILKATSSRFHVAPKEKHVLTLKLAAQVGGSRMSVDYIITGLLDRLHSATDWLTALKTLITFHRLFRETDPKFMEELLKVGEGKTKGRGSRVLAVENFLDTTNMEGRFDYSEWVRAYGKYLDEQLELLSAINWNINMDAANKTESRFRNLNSKDLLYQLPHLQRLQRRLMDCIPRGIAAHDHVVMFSLSMVLNESLKVYKAISECVINLADKFFELEYLDAVKALELYKECVDSGEALNKYFVSLEQIEEIKRTVQLPVLKPPPYDIIEAMEAYIKDAPRPIAAGDGEAAAPARVRSVPLRKGRYVTQASLPSTTASFDFSGSGSGSGGVKDPGMLLSGPQQPSSATAVQAEQVEEETPEVAVEKIPEPAAAPLMEMDLLAFDDASEPVNGMAASEATTTAATEQDDATKKPAPTPLDLLSALDFGFTSSSAEPTPYGLDSRGSNTYSIGMSSNGSSFPNTPAPTPVYPQQQQMFQQQMPPPGYGIPQQQQQQYGYQHMPSPPQPQQQQQGGWNMPPQQQQHQSPVQMMRPGAIPSPQQQTSPQQLLKAAGTLDPFSGLAQIPRK